MKNKVIVILSIVGILGLCCVPMFADSNETFDFVQWGKALKANSDKNNAQTLKENSEADTVLLKGENAVVTDSEIEMGTKFYQATGLSEEESKKEAIQYFEEYEAMYAEATKKGYTATEDEIENYLEEMKNSLFGETTDEETQEQYKTMIAQFDSEEEYWEYEKEVYKKQLPIQKFVQDLEQQYFKENVASSDDDWLEYFEKYKENLVKQEKYCRSDLSQK